MGNTPKTPIIKANNTRDAYHGSIDNLWQKKLSFQLYNPVYGESVFVSDADKIKGDFLVQSHPHHSEQRNHFYLRKIDGTDWDGFVLYHSKSGGFLFVSNDMSGRDHVVESHPYLKEKRNCFIFERKRDHLYTICNTEYNEYIFVSNDTRGSTQQNHVLLAHPHENEERNLFEIRLINPEDDDNEEKDQKMDHRIVKDTPVKEDSDEEDNKLCIVCMEHEKDYVIVQCGHIAVCGQCKQECY
eukprot:243828_1